MDREVVGIRDVDWSLHRIPILSPPKAMIDEMSSVSTEAAPGSANGRAPGAVAAVVRFSQIEPLASQVAHSWPVESLARTSVSDC